MEENRKFEFVIRDIHGRRNRVIIDTEEEAYKFCQQMAESETAEEVDCLAIFEGDRTWYSVMMNNDWLTWEDLLGFFA